MRHGHRGAAARQTFEGRVDRGLGGRVQGRCRLVEQQNGRVAQHRPRNCDPLSLAARKADPAFAARSLVTLRQRKKEFVNLGGPRGRFDLRIRGPGPAHPDVFPHRRVKQEVLLKNDAGLAAIRIEVALAKIHTIYHHGALVRIIETKQQIQDRALARSAGSHKRHRAAA